MLVFSASDKGGTGRSVTSCNIAYRMCMQGNRVAYVDFDLGSPTAGALFEITGVERGVSTGGVHSYLLGETGEPERIDVQARTDRTGLQKRGPQFGHVVLLPGNEAGAEIVALSPDAAYHMVRRCEQLLRDLTQEFDVVLVDLSAGRSTALEVALRSTGSDHRLGRSTSVRWLVFHRWTRQHILAASGLVYGVNGILQTGQDAGHEVADLLGSLRFVRTAVSGLAAKECHRPPQTVWLERQDEELKRLASQLRLGKDMVLAEIPEEPMLQRREQVILDADVDMGVAEPETKAAYTKLANRLLDQAAWDDLE